MMKSTYLILILIILIGSKINAQHYNQVGYLPNSVKRVFLTSDCKGNNFVIVNEIGNEVYSGKISNSKYWDQSGQETCIADFTNLRVEGEYLLIIDGISEEIKVGVHNDALDELSISTMKMYYHARASMTINKSFGGEYARPSGHPDNEVIVHASAASTQRPEGTIISSIGGWYDAGDYNKYIVNSAISTFTLLHTVEMYQENVQNINLSIPESGDGVPDLLNETLYNLRWMLSMQDPNDGGVYHKLTSKKFSKMVMPHEDKLPRFVVMKTTAASLDFAATMAKAYRVLQPYRKKFPKLIDECKCASINAWEWCINNPAVLYEQPDDIKTGTYGDKKIDDEWLWAASELYLSTGKKEYLKSVKLEDTYFDVPTWGNVASLSLYSILNTKPKKREFKRIASEHLIRLAERYYQVYNESAYKVSINKFKWGSNSDVCNQGMMFLSAYKITEDHRFLEAADACLGYILGANSTGYCFVTGYGIITPTNVHDRRSESDSIDKPVPGFLVGGPNLSRQGDCGEEKYPSASYAALSYLDLNCSYSTNEVAINWNAPLVFLVCGVNAELRK